MRNWSEYTWLLNHMVETGFIKTIREIWWDVRPHHNFGTVEVRICDMPPSLKHVLGLTALIQCLVYDLSQEIDRGTYQYDCHPFMIRQNKWRACRYGHGCQAGRSRPPTRRFRRARWSVPCLIAVARPRRGARLLVVPRDHPRHARSTDGLGAAKCEAFDETHDLAEVVRRMLAYSEASVG